MLSALVKEHQNKQQQLRQENEKKRKKAAASVEAVTNNMMDSINMGVAKVFSNQREIEKQIGLVQSETDRFCKQTTQWLHLVENFNQALKEIGDVENWSRTIEQDMRNIASSLEYVHRKSAPFPSSE